MTAHRRNLRTGPGGERMGPAAAMFVLFFALMHTCAAQASLTPGAQSGDCRSALVVGVAACHRLDGAAPSAAPPAVTEAQIDAFLDQYGKPPRQAVRALLDPSDENIAAWLRTERRVRSVAAYVAQRMTELQSRLDAGTEAADAARSATTANADLRHPSLRRLDAGSPDALALEREMAALRAESEPRARMPATAADAGQAP